MSSSPTTSRRASSSTTDLALIATFAALIAVCAILPAINASSPTPFTFQMFGIFLAAAVLGPKRGTLAVLLYLAVGTAGVPVFAKGAAGPGTWTGVTGGYLVSFPIAACLVGLAAYLVVRRSPTAFVGVVAVAIVVVTVAVVGTLGTYGMMRSADTSWAEAWGWATPFFVADISKGVVAAIIAAAVHRAFPQLLRG